MPQRTLLQIVSIENISDAGTAHAVGNRQLGLLNDAARQTWAPNKWMEIVLGSGWLALNHQMYRSAHTPLDQMTFLVPEATKASQTDPESIVAIWIDSLDANYVPHNLTDVRKTDPDNQDEGGNNYTFRTLVTFNAGWSDEYKKWLGHYNPGENPSPSSLAGDPALDFSNAPSNGQNGRGSWIAAATMTSEQDVYTYENGEERNNSTELDAYGYLTTAPTGRVSAAFASTNQMPLFGRNHSREDVYEEPATHDQQGRMTPSAYKKVKTVTCRPGDWIKLITAESWFSGASGYLLTRANFGSYRSGAFLHNQVKLQLNYSAMSSKASADTGVPYSNVTFIRVPTNAKSGPFTMMARKWTTTWRGRKKHDFAMGRSPASGPGGWETDVPIPIYIIGGGGPLAIEAFQCGLSNTGNVVGRGNVEDMINSSGAATQKGDSSQIGSSPLITIPPCRNNMAMYPGTHFPIGQTAGGVHFTTSYVKEMRFRVSMMANAANYTPALTYMMMLSMVTLATPMLALVAHNFVSAYNSIYQSLILHEMGQASGGSSFMKLHRCEPIFDTAYEGSEDMTQPAGPTSCSFFKVMQSKTGGSTISAIMLFDYSKLRFVPANPLHESFTEQGGPKGGWAGPAVKMLDCDGESVVLNEDGTVKDWRSTGGRVNRFTTAHTLQCRYADYDGYWAISSSNDAPQQVDGCGDGAPLGCEHKQQPDGTWHQPVTGEACPKRCMEMDPLKSDFQKYTKATELVNGYKDTPAGTPNNEWIYSHQNNLTDPTTGKPLVHKRWIWSMTPIMSPLPFRNVATDYNATARTPRAVSYSAAGTLINSDHKKDFHPQPGWHHHSTWDHVRSEGLAAGGGLYFPWFKARAIGKGQLTTVSAQLYSEDYRCLACSAKDWGKDARLCQYNKNALGTGGWYLGEGGSASFYLLGAPMRAAGEVYSAFAASKNTTLIAGIQAYQSELPDDLKLYYKPRDIAKHDRSKSDAGAHYGGWPENVFASTASYARQAGSSCYFSSLEERIMKGHGFEYWRQGCIPTFVKNDISWQDIYAGQMHKWDKMRNNGRLLVTERIDQIYVTDALISAPDNWLPVDPDTYEFYPGQFVKVRCFPTTTTTSTPTKAVKIKDFNDYDPFGGEFAAGGAGGGGIIPSASTAIFKAENDKLSSMTPDGISRLYTIGSVGGGLIGSYAKGAATPYSMRFGTTSGPVNLNGGYVTALMCSTTAPGILWGKFDKIGGRNSEILNLNERIGFQQFDRVSRNVGGGGGPKGRHPASRFALGIACGQVIDDGNASKKPKPMVTPWMKGLTTGDIALSRDAFSGSFFKNLRGVTWGKNGPSCWFQVIDAQTMIMKLPTSAGQTHHSSDDSKKPPFSWSGTETNQLWLYYESPIGWATEFNSEGGGKMSLYEVEQKAKSQQAGGDPQGWRTSYNGAYPSICYIPVIGRCRIKTKNYLEGIDSTLIPK